MIPWLIVGLFVGFTLGMIFMSLLVSASRADEAQLDTDPPLCWFCAGSGRSGGGLCAHCTGDAL